MGKRTAKTAFTAIFMVMMLVALTACGSGTDGEKSGASNNPTGYYASTTNVAFTSAYPEHTFKRATFGVQSIETFADNTYILTSTGTSFSGALLFEDSGEYDVVPRGADITKYYGTVTVKDEDGLRTLELSQPTSVIVNSSYSAGANPIGYLNTLAWTDEMGQAAGGEGAALTAEQYLESVSFPATSIIVDPARASFDYTVLKESEEATH
ncbi:hypothetical protein [Paenibacillus amylolyticus]|uniref:Lipoprotein n=1 Tax=Paenibacillus amylolyticus TaxID=1451 RepID=A0A100VNW0_PAEAM|nr:hypothetical protein [Paenibacillus amylolyticus]GAS83333.1 unknown protein [Paenibacillus amylolyticus]